MDAVWLGQLNLICGMPQTTRESDRTRQQMTGKPDLFDKIRVKPSKEKQAKQEHPPCEWEGCTRAGTNMAPIGRGQEGKYRRFCMDHVRQYNKSYNYFSGLGDDDVAAYHKDSQTGHRPTWSMGVNAAAKNAARAKAKGKVNGAFNGTVNDPFDLFGPGARPAQPQAEETGRKVRRLEMKSFDTLGLEATATADQIKARYKELVKRHHPDANGGDRTKEDRLREILQAYNYLKKTGYCS